MVAAIEWLPPVIANLTSQFGVWKMALKCVARYGRNDACWLVLINRKKILFIVEGVACFCFIRGCTSLSCKLDCLFLSLEY
jgi:hypothetical protein